MAPLLAQLNDLLPSFYHRFPRILCPHGFFCASSPHGEWRDSSWCDPPTCHACFPTAGSGLPGCYLDTFPVARPVQLPGPHISWKDGPEWLSERDLRLLVLASCRACSCLTTLPTRLQFRHLG